MHHVGTPRLPVARDVGQQAHGCVVVAGMVRLQVLELDQEAAQSPVQVLSHGVAATAGRRSQTCEHAVTSQGSQLVDASKCRTDQIAETWLDVTSGWT